MEIKGGRLKRKVSWDIRQTKYIFCPSK